MVLLAASVERVGVSRMRDLSLHILHIGKCGGNKDKPPPYYLAHDTVFIGVCFWLGVTVEKICHLFLCPSSSPTPPPLTLSLLIFLPDHIVSPVVIQGVAADELNHCQPQGQVVAGEIGQIMEPYLVRHGAVETVTVAPETGVQCTVYCTVYCVRCTAQLCTQCGKCSDFGSLLGASINT